MRMSDNAGPGGGERRRRRRRGGRGHRRAGGDATTGRGTSASSPTTSAPGSQGTPPEGAAAQGAPASGSGAGSDAGSGSGSGSAPRKTGQGGRRSGRRQGARTTKGAKGTNGAKGGRPAKGAKGGRAAAQGTRRDARADRPAERRAGGTDRHATRSSRTAPARQSATRPSTARRSPARPVTAEHNDLPTSVETSAGGLVLSGLPEAVQPDGSVDFSRIYVALIGRLDRRGRLLWSMPKGHIEPDESHHATAEREVWEETGIAGEVFADLGTIDYWFVSDGVRIHKTVHHHLLRYVDGDLNDEDPEVTEVAWLPVSHLVERLAYADERTLARQAYDRLPDLARADAAAGRATPR
ncbi:NUDIX hydrolase [Corynebacterium bovis]|uniref:NUDIX hydrolase n=1 Tax=Corynebacterium bovis TaxID=36808 RepID=UPI003CC76BE4